MNMFERLNFDIAEGEDDIIEKLVAEYNGRKSNEDFIYENRHYLSKLDPSRIRQFLKVIGEAKKFDLQHLHEAFNNNNLQ